VSQERDLRGVAGVVGVADTAIGEVGEGVSALEVAAEASLLALEDAGLSKDEVDGLFVASTASMLPTLALGEYLGISPRFADATRIGGSSFISLLSHAAIAIEAGACEVALIAYGSVQRSQRGKLDRGRSDELEYEAPYAPRMPVSAYALAAARHMHEFGTTREQLAEVAVAAREWAKLNPRAFRREDLSVEDVLGSPIVSSPLSVRDCCLVTDGAGAVVVTGRERARALRPDTAYLLGAGEAQTHLFISQMPDLTTTAAVESSRRAYQAAGVGPESIDTVQLYDAFTINVVIFLEDLGFCPKGEGGPFVSGGRIGPDGELPVNTNGGGLSYCHPGMYGIFTIIEAARQIRGSCGARQRRADLALVHGNGGVLSSQATAVLGSEETIQ
jgi:acetyl-CoA acetyltransferase